MVLALLAAAEETSKYTHLPIRLQILGQPSGAIADAGTSHSKDALLGQDVTELIDADCCVFCSR